MGDILVTHSMIPVLVPCPISWYSYPDERSAVGNRAVDYRGDSFASGGVYYNAVDTAHYDAARCDAAQRGRRGGQCAGL